MVFTVSMCVYIYSERDDLILHFEAEKVKNNC